LLTLARK